RPPSAAVLRQGTGRGRVCPTTQAYAPCQIIYTNAQKFLGSLSVEVATRPEVGHAARDPLLPAFRPRLGRAADAFDLDRVRAGEADPVEDLPDPHKVDAAPLAEGREVPVLEAAAIVLQVHVAHQVFDPLQLVARVGALVVIGDVAGIEVQEDLR